MIVIPELPSGRWWERMSLAEYTAVVEARRRAHQADMQQHGILAEAAAWRSTGTKTIQSGPPLFPRIRRGEDA